MSCHPGIWTPISAISSPFSFNILCLFALLTLDGSSHLIGSNFKTNYSLEPLKTCPYYCVPYLWEIFVLIWLLLCSNKIIFPSVYDFRIMILSAAIVCFETFTDQSTYQQGLDSLWGYFYSLCILKKNWPTYKLAGSQKSHPHPPLNQNPTPWLETGPVDTCVHCICYLFDTSRFWKLWKVPM